MMDLTTTTATQRAGVLSTTTAESAELSLDAQREALDATKGLAVEADDAGEGIASDTASALGNALSAVLDVVRSVLGPSTATDALDDDAYAPTRARIQDWPYRSRRALLGAGLTNVSSDELSPYSIVLNLTETTKRLCSGLLVSSLFGGATDKLGKDRFGLECYRATEDSLGGGSAALKLTTPTNPEAATLPRAFYADAGLSAAGDYADVRLVTFDKNLFAVPGGDNETINGGVTALSVYDADYGAERD